MTTDKHDTSKNTESPAPATAKASTGKIRGKGTVTPKAAEERKGVVHDEGQKDLDLAYEEGYRASQTGQVRPKPRPEYGEAEVKAWHAGYKAHANPNSRGQVEGIESGYRKDY